METEEVFIGRWTPRADPFGFGGNYKLSCQVRLLTEAETKCDVHPPASDIKEQPGHGICINLGGWGKRQLGKSKSNREGSSGGWPLLHQYLPSCRGGLGWGGCASLGLLETGWGQGQVGVGTHQWAGQPGLRPPGHSAQEREPAEPSRSLWPGSWLTRSPH